MWTAISIGFVALSILWQDLRSRSVYALQLLVLFILAMAEFFLNDATTLHDLFFNFCWLLIQFGLLLAYVKTRGAGPLFEQFGMGDILFLMAAVPLLPTPVFIAFYMSGLIFSLLIGGIVRLFQPSSSDSSIPLAGYMSIWLLLLFIWNKFFAMEAWLLETLSSAIYG